MKPQGMLQSVLEQPTETPHAATVTQDPPPVLPQHLPGDPRQTDSYARIQAVSTLQARFPGASITAEAFSVDYARARNVYTVKGIVTMPEDRQFPYTATLSVSGAQRESVTCKWRLDTNIAVGGEATFERPDFWVD